jgi:hypothetical protein
MTYQTLITCTQDPVLQQRVTAAAMKESYSGGPEFSESSFAAQLQQNPSLAMVTFMWPIAIDNEADYAYAIDTDHEAPGSADVINDAKLQAGVQAHWPEETTVPVQTGE